MNKWTRITNFLPQPRRQHISVSENVTIEFYIEFIFGRRMFLFACSLARLVVLFVICSYYRHAHIIAAAAFTCRQRRRWYTFGVTTYLTIFSYICFPLASLSLSQVDFSFVWNLHMQIWMALRHLLKCHQHFNLWGLVGKIFGYQNNNSGSITGPPNFLLCVIIIMRTAQALKRSSDEFCEKKRKREMNSKFFRWTRRKKTSSAHTHTDTQIKINCCYLWIKVAPIR